MFSGLNLACFSLSRLQLEIEASNHNESAIKVLNLRRDANFLLTTILWGNVGVNTLLALLSGSVLGGIAAFLFSTVFITLFAEISPQAYFSRNALRVAALLSPVLKFYQIVLYPVAKPAAKVLDWWLGPEGVHYPREEMLKSFILKSMGEKGTDIGRFEGQGAVNFLALNQRHVGEEGNTVDPDSIIALPAVNDQVEFPAHGGSPYDEFVDRVRASGKKWIILTDTGGAAHLLMNTDRFLRAASTQRDVDPQDYCVRPIISHDPQETLEQALMRIPPVQPESRGRGIVLLWGVEKRIIAHADVLRRLFDGILSPPPLHQEEKD
jgi:hypothetical protein